LNGGRATGRADSRLNGGDLVADDVADILGAWDEAQNTGEAAQNKDDDHLADVALDDIPQEF